MCLTYLACPPMAFSVSQTAVVKWDKSKDGSAGYLHCQQLKKIQFFSVNHSEGFVCRGFLQAKIKIYLSVSNKIHNKLKQCKTLVSN